jgi:putative ABC transport system permease protein
MLIRTLRADFRRTSTTSIVLAGLIAIAALLAATGAGVLAQLTGAVNELFATARTPDVVQMHAGDIDRDALEAWTAGRTELAEWQLSETLPIPPDLLFLGEEPQSGSVLQPALVVQNESFDLLLDLDDEVLGVGPGEIAMPLYYHQTQGLEVGDVVSIRLPEARFDFTVTAFVRDSMMNPTFATSKRLLISTEDHREIAGHIDEHEYLIEFLVADRADTRAVSDAYSKTGPATNGPLLDRGTFFLLNAVSHGIGIAVLSLLAVLMVAVAAIALRFSFLTAVERDTHEIGVMKAIGMPDKRVRRVYLTKYVALALVGGVAGLALSVPAARAVTASLRLQLGEPAGSWWLTVAPMLGAGLVVLGIVAWCALMLRRIGRISTIDALRAAGPPRRRRRWLPIRKSRSRLTGSPLPAGVWMGLNDIRRNFRTHRMLLAVLTLCTFLVLVPVNLWTTVTSPTFITYLGTGVADLRLELRTPAAVAQSSELMSELGQDPDVARVAPFVTARFEVLNTDGEWEQLPVETGDHQIFPLSYLEGNWPATVDEVSLSSLAAESVGAHIGDSITLRGTSGERDVTLVGIYQDMTNGGRTAKAMVPVDEEPIVWRTLLVDAADGVAPAELAERLSSRFPAVQTIQMSEFADQTLGDLTRQTGTVAFAAAVTALVLAALIAAMFAQMVIARDQSQIAIQRGLGVADGRLRLQYLTRFVTVLVAGVGLGVALVATIGRSMVASMIGSLGAPALRFDVEPLLAYVAVPLSLTVTVATVALIATRSFDHLGISRLNEE